MAIITPATTAKRLPPTFKLLAPLTAEVAAAVVEEVEVAALDEEPVEDAPVELAELEEPVNVVRLPEEELPVVVETATVVEPDVEAMEAVFEAVTDVEISNMPE